MATLLGAPLSASAHDASAHAASAHSLVVHAVAPVVTVSDLPPFELGKKYDTTITVTSATSPTWAVVVGALPKGLDLNATTGEITGTPDLSITQTSFAFTIRVTNASGPTDAGFTTIVSNPSTVPVITTTAVDAATVGTQYSFTFTATGKPRATLTVTGTAGALPDGLTYDPATSTLSGTPTKAGSSSVFVQATNAAGATLVTGFAFLINPGAVATPSPTPTPTGGTQTANPGSPTATIQQIDPLAPGSGSGGGSGSNSPSHLASTGADVSVGLVAGAAGLFLVALGFAVVVIRRMRRLTD